MSRTWVVSRGSTHRPTRPSIACRLPQTRPNFRSEYALALFVSLLLVLLVNHLVFWVEVEVVEVFFLVLKQGHLELVQQVLAFVLE